jgi:hypothetical protein
LSRLARWFWRLDEDSAGYEDCRQAATHARFVLRKPRRHSWAQPGGAAGSGKSLLGWSTALAYRAQDWRLEAALRFGRFWPGWSVRRWELAWPDVILVWAGLLAVWSAMLPVSLIAWRVGGSESAWLILRGAVLASGALVQIAVTVLPHLERRWLLGFESLRPVTRRRLLGQWGAALLWRMLAGGLSLGALFCILFLLNGHRVGVVAGLVWGFYLLAVLATYAALLIWLRTSGGEVLQGVVAVGGSIFYYWALGSLSAVLTLSESLLLVAAAATVLAAASVWILRSAYHRWLVIDLD